MEAADLSRWVRRLWATLGLNRRHSGVQSLTGAQQNWGMSDALELKAGSAKPRKMKSIMYAILRNCLSCQLLIWIPMTTAPALAFDSTPSRVKFDNNFKKDCNPWPMQLWLRVLRVGMQSPSENPQGIHRRLLDHGKTDWNCIQNVGGLLHWRDFLDPCFLWSPLSRNS